MSEAFSVYPIGVIRKGSEDVTIEVFAEYHAALLGLEGFSHISVLYWFHKNDTSESRRILQVHPRGEASNPMTGVFATHSPVRPNLIAISLCRVQAVEEGIVRIDTIDAIDGTPVLDIKCYIPTDVSRDDVRVPDWVRSREVREQARVSDSTP